MALAATAFLPANNYKTRNRAIQPALFMTIRNRICNNRGVTSRMISFGTSWNYQQATFLVTEALYKRD